MAVVVARLLAIAEAGEPALSQVYDDNPITRANGFESTRCLNNITDNYVMSLYRINKL